MWESCTYKAKKLTMFHATSDATPNTFGNAAQICAMEGVEDRISDDDDQQDAVNLASPDLPKQKSISGSKQTPSSPELQKQEDKNAKGLKQSHEQERKPLPISEPKKSKLYSSGPSRAVLRKLLTNKRSNLNELMTEVVWEGEDTEAKADDNTMKKADNNPVNSNGDRPPMAKKSPALGSTAPTNQAGKAGNKKAGNKDLNREISYHFLRRRLRDVIFQLPF
ncbi:hypothetical protein HAX54_006971 [Datura stramonium]|uniref:Uncharacterized protein n=1 Tax=Datura stramonium TaxID=4076 RepID=A0ABS8TB11_DATST|nr:hypothetical protein [Datura stramonium]